MHVQIFSSHPKSGAKTPPNVDDSRRLLSLTAKLTANIFRKKHGVDSQGTAVETTKGSSRLFKNCVNVGSQTAKNGTEIPTLRKFYIILHCQASHMVSKQNSTKLHETVL